MSISPLHIHAFQTLDDPKRKEKLEEEEANFNKAIELSKSEQLLHEREYLGAQFMAEIGEELTEEQQKMINANPEAYVDFNIPWTLNLSYNFGYSRQGLAKGTTIQTLRINGDFSLTPKWKFTFDTGADIVARAPSITNIGITRDLHCWEMSFNWTPFAGSGIRANNYNFEIRAKSALLRDLKLSRRRSFYDQGGFR